MHKTPNSPPPPKCKQCSMKMQEEKLLKFLLCCKWCVQEHSPLLSRMFFFRQIFTRIGANWKIGCSKCHEIWNEFLFFFTYEKKKEYIKFSQSQKFWKIVIYHKRVLFELRSLYNPHLNSIAQFEGCFQIFNFFYLTHYWSCNVNVMT